MFSNDLIDVREGLEDIDEKIPKGLKIYPRQFSRLSYYELLPIVHLFKECSRDTNENIEWKA